MKHVPHIYVKDWGHKVLDVAPEQQRHVTRVLRTVAGDPISYTNGEGLLGSGIWDGTSVVRGDEEMVARPSELVVAVAPPANKDRLRFTVEKLAELGVERLVWLETKWGGRRVPPVEKQSAWAISALEQSRGAWLMWLGDDLVGWSDLEQPIVVCQPGGESLVELTRTVVIGPEGGFDPGEIPPGTSEISLGPTVLRVETAAVAAAIKFRP
ncbi:MAG TPA: 16S rRNA (uracil(1498)-N(3))-methyltransferase [Acidimicrobiia bacterium]